MNERRSIRPPTPWCAAGVIVISAALLLPAPAVGQTALSVEPRGDLAFGQLIQGLPTRIAPADRAAGQFRIRGQSRAEVLVVFTLPFQMTGPLGQTLPLSFQAGDATWTTGGNPRSAIAFDPNVPLVASFAASGTMNFFLGGTASPAADQGAGDYAGTITLTVSYTGN